MTWFETTARGNFEKHLLPLADEPLACLQLGVWTGDASLWILENLPKARLTDVDNWRGSEEHSTFDMDQIKGIYAQRTEPYQDRVVVRVQNTTEVLVHFLPDQYDFIYIDADHHAPSVLSDAVLAWPLLKKGGLMAFDDFTWQAETEVPQDSPALGISAFCAVYKNQLETLEANSQVWIKKC